MCRTYANLDGRWLVNPMFINPLGMSPPYPCATQGLDEPNGDQGRSRDPMAASSPTSLTTYTEESFAAEHDMTPLLPRGCRQMSEVR